MPRKSPFSVEPTSEERRELEARTRKYTSPYRDVIRASYFLELFHGNHREAPVVVVFSLALAGRTNISPKW